MSMKKLFMLLALMSGGSVLLRAAAPVVSNVRASKSPSTKVVDIYYDLADPDSSSLTVTVAVFELVPPLMS